MTTTAKPTKRRSTKAAFWLRRTGAGSNDIPAFTPGTVDPGVVTYTVINPNLPVDISLRAKNLYHGANIQLECGGRVTTKEEKLKILQ
jgi:hypothetical protein